MTSPFVQPRKFGTGWWAKVYTRVPGIPSAEAFGALIVARIEQINNAGNIVSEEVFGALTISAGGINITVPAMDFSNALSTSITISSVYSITATGLTSAEAYGTSVITTGDVGIILSALASDEAYGSITITTGNVNITSTAIGTAEAFGAVILSVGGVTITIVAMNTDETYGTSVITTGDVNIGIERPPGDETVNGDMESASPWGQINYSTQSSDFARTGTYSAKLAAISGGAANLNVTTGPNVLLGNPSGPEDTFPGEVWYWEFW
jgi:hypothetical protein